MSQLHKNFTDSEVKKLIERYIKGQIKRVHLEKILGIKRRRICELVKKYRDDPENFSIGYSRGKPTRKISDDANKAIISELEFEKGLIDDSNIPLRSYNYSYIKDRISHGYGIDVSLSTVINRTKKYGFYKKMGKLVSLIHNKGKYAFYHSDGKIDEIVPDLVDIGMDAINPVQSEVMDYKRLKREYGKNISFYGGLSHQKVLAFGETKDVINEIREKIEILSKNGGYIAGTGLTPPPGIPLENLIALIENLKEQVHT